MLSESEAAQGGGHARRTRGENFMKALSKAASNAARLATVAALAIGLQAVPALAKDRPTAAPEEVGLSPEQLARLDAKMHSYVDSGKTGGVVTLIARHGKIAHFNAYGWADRETQQPMERDTVVRMFSMTKPVASVALLMLYEEGKFQLTDPLEKYIPEFTNVMVFAGRDANGEAILEKPKRKITIQDVFRHTAGFSYGEFGDAEIDKAFVDAGMRMKNQEDFAKSLASFPLIYQPGEKWFYSFSHDMQAYLVEYFSGMSFAEFCRTRIFEPLDMPNTFFGQPVERPGNYATLYLKGEDGEVTTVPWDQQPRYGSTILGGSGMSSNARDYLQFAQMLLNRGELDGVRLLNPRTVDFMATNHLAEGIQAGSFKGRGYGLGVEVVTDPVQYGYPMSKGQFGWSGAATTYFAVDPKEDMVTILVTQIRMDNDLLFDFSTQSHLAVMD
jgi:CubicO group peptidase (beta-lactamase class C family)